MGDIAIRNPGGDVLVRESLSPLEYPRAARVHRFELVDPSLPPPRRSDAYFAETRQYESYGRSGRRLKRPRVTVIPGAPQDVAAFLDWHEYGERAAYIDYMKVRQDLRGQGLAAELVQAFFDAIVLPRGMTLVHWGKVMSPAVWVLMERMREAYPAVQQIGHRDF